MQKGEKGQHEDKSKIHSSTDFIRVSYDNSGDVSVGSSFFDFFNAD